MSALSWRIGNDVVDLGNTYAQNQLTNRRFIERVFTPGERAAIARATMPLHALWSLWAAKEAAFKIARKADAGVVFAHAKFEVDLDAGLVRGPACGEVNARWDVTDERIHCVALAPSSGFAPSPKFSLSSDLVPSPRVVVEVQRLANFAEARTTLPRSEELRSARSEESLAVRRLAKSVAIREFGPELGCDDASVVAGRLSIIRQELGIDPVIFGPPSLWCDGHRVEAVDLSLSHDGAWLAVAMIGASV